MAREEEKRGSRVWIEYGKIRINERWWKWDDEEEVLRNEKRNRRG